MGSASRRLTVLLASLVSAAALGGARADVNPAAPVAAAAGHPSGQRLFAAADDVRGGQRRSATLAVDGRRRLARDCAGELCTGTWFDGRRRSTFGLNGTPLPDPAAGAAAERTFEAIASTAFAEPAFEAAGGTVEALPAADGRLRYRVNAPQGEALVAVATAATLRLTGVEWPDGSPYRRLRATIGGPTILYAERAYDRVGPLETAVVPPIGPAAVITDARDLPLLPGMLPMVPCALGGRPATCLLDTGSTPSGVTLDFAEKLGREPHGAIEIAGLVPYLTGVVEAGPLVLGPATFDSLHFAVIPRARGADFDVIIGSDVLAALRLELAPGRRRATLGPSHAAASGTPVVLDFTDGLPYVAVRLGSRDTTQAMLVDTGDSGFLSIGYDQYREDLGLFAARSAASASGIGAGSMDAVAGKLDRAEIAGEAVDRVPITAVRGQHQGHVGYGFAGWCGRLSLELGQGRLECTSDAAHP